MKNLVQTLLLSSVAALFASCNSSTSGPESFREPISYTPDGKCTIGWSDTKTQEQLDSLRTFCDTIFVRSVVDVYKDTVYDDTVITDNKKYTSFIYFDRYTEKNDTLTQLTAEKSGDSGPCGSVPVYCNLDSSDMQKTFSCKQASVCYMYDLDASSAKTVVVRLPDMHYDSTVIVVSKSVCSVPGFRCVRDTIFHDAFHTTYRTIARDTTFLNYGPTAWTDYVPAINAPAFDTAAFRNALDTLDTQKEIFGMDTLFTGYSVSVEGLPDWASTRKKDVCKTVKDSASICVVTITDVLRPYGIAYTYPTPYYRNSFYLTNYLESPLEKDTLITWKLKYSYYNGHSFKGNSGSLEITTLFKGI
ncbi:hypothetical protein [Fibrobacter sp. UWB3]|uniref:hypothetical protein n=1 Tax=Fibrobacter sp. UWB3 TaxID=1964357 RepID=UPI000B527874|nr:hypothetical protein [Fibrobacter sp. UWB3]OWV22626.1 hypothetical protein B7991_00155 [Fibrobacter sp. UWB3]